ncbi:hypothetical protein [Harryflintia acetispora]|uniref:VCBS repeat-containing protein n=1 Tax=Harryflintia acetispora TaxID=1849041 RepID=A0A9X8Y7T6_9FIRM|nr:hypothetical protein [Harryflintia acetispora]TCL42812.1 hypothetical protein EDD78_108125 [Harryflintia acetispora]
MRRLVPLVLSGLLLLAGCAGAPGQQNDVPPPGAAPESAPEEPAPMAGAPRDELLERLSEAANSFVNGEDFVPWQYNLGLYDFDGDGSPELIVGSYGNFSGTHTLLRLTEDAYEVVGDYEVPNGSCEFYPAASGDGLVLIGKGGHGTQEIVLESALRLLPEPDEAGGLLDVWQRTYTLFGGDDAQSACTVTHNGEEQAACQSPQDPEAAAFDARFAHGDTPALVAMEEEAFFAGTEDNGEILLPVPQEELRTRIDALLERLEKD